MALRRVNVPEEPLHRLVLVQVFSAPDLEEQIDRTRAQPGCIGAVAPELNLSAIEGTSLRSAKPWHDGSCQ